MPRRFGEGLGDEPDDDQPAVPAPEISSIEALAPREDEPAQSPLEAESSLWPETVRRDWDTDQVRAADQEYEREREHGREDEQ